jgi:hypothetical protein
VTLVIRRITIAVLAAFLAGAVLAVPATSASGPAAVAKKKHKKKCKKKKAKKGKKGKKCKKARGGGNSSGSGLPGQATPSSPKQPNQPVTPATLHVTSLDVSASTVLGGTSTTGHVVIDAPAPSGGQLVSLSSNASRASVPSSGSVIVAPGETSASFEVKTAKNDPGTATLLASIGGSDASTQLNVVDTASVSSLQMERHCLTVGPLSSNLVTLDVPAPETTVVDLNSDNAALTVPASVVVPMGQTSAAFSATAVSVIPSVTVTATLGSSNASETVSVSDTSPEPTSASMTLQPGIVTAGDSSVATLTLDCEATEDVVFSLSAQGSVGNPTNVTLPPTVTVHAGERSAQFTVGSGSARVDDYAVTATAGDLTASHTLTVQGQPD